MKLKKRERKRYIPGEKSMRGKRKIVRRRTCGGGKKGRIECKRGRGGEKRRMRHCCLLEEEVICNNLF